MIHGVAQDLFVNEVELHMVPALVEIASDQGRQLMQVFLILDALRIDFYIQEGPVGPAVIQFAH